MNDNERKIVTEIVKTLFVQLSAHSLKRCTFFADAGYSILEKIAGDYNPQILGDDTNPFNQHYWLGISFLSEDIKKRKTVIIDPIFGYIGLEEKTEELLDKVHLDYYRRKRVVLPNVSYLNGGIRIKTMSI